MDTLTTAPAYGSVEYYADLISRHATTRDAIRIVTLSGIDTAVLSAPDAAVAIERVRNALAAGEQAIEEMRTAR